MQSFQHGKVQRDAGGRGVCRDEELFQSLTLDEPVDIQVKSCIRGPDIKENVFQGVCIF